MRHPNILFVFSDQHRWCDLGCYGNEDIRSPNLDRFANENLRFDFSCCNSPLCVPARGSLLTGVYPLRHGAVTNDLPIRHDVTSVADVLSASGYNTGFIGKWHLAGVPRDQPIPAGRGRLGFKSWKVRNCSHDYQHAWYHDENGHRHEIDGYEATAQTDLAINFIRTQDKQPWALWLSWGPPHDPYWDVPDSWLNIYRNQAITLRSNVPDTGAFSAPGKQIDSVELRNWLRGYYAHISALDHEFGRLLSTLDACGVAENTIVVYTSDHGDLLGSHGRTQKQMPYDEAIRVPLLARWPGRIRPGICRELIGLVDLPVSILALAGLHFPGAPDGEDLSRLFTLPNAQGRNAVYLFEHIAAHLLADAGGREWRGLRTKTHTFARTAVDAGFLLTDNVADPFQRRNLIGDAESAPLQRAFSGQLDSLIQAHDSLLPWDDFIRAYGLLDTWNRSQRYFGRAELSMVPGVSGFDANRVR